MSHSISLRLPDAIFRRLEERRLAGGQTRSRLVHELLEEGLRMEEHPGIVFRSGPSGRRAALSAGPDVWQVIAVFRELEERGEDAIALCAELTGIAADRVRIAVRYYAAFAAEIDAWIEANDRAAVEAESGWRREQGLVA